MKNEQFITIQGWMRNELGLKGNELLVYALIYGFSQDEESEFSGSIGYIADWTGATKQTIHNTLKSLCEKELLHKEESFIKGVKYCSYRAIILPVKKFDGGSQKILPNSIEDNIERKDKDSNSIYNHSGSCHSIYSMKKLIIVIHHLVYGTHLIEFANLPYILFLPIPSFYVVFRNTSDRLL